MLHNSCNKQNEYKYSCGHLFPLLQIINSHELVCLISRNKYDNVLMLHSYASMIVLLFCHNHFINVYCHMLIAALDFMLRRSRETVLRTLYAHACHEIRATSSTWISTKGDQRSLDPSVDSKSFVLYLKPYISLCRLLIKQSLGQDFPRSFGESGGSSGA
jgi:hypothetical protein